ncbi:MAG: hypothetical protein JST12_16220 [Armatimonadetes bacterium]|nr:hypothetical protein [Armatimonadota bacterium]
MNPEFLLSAALQTSVVFLLVWLVFRLVPAIPANTKAWIWRLAFLKPLIVLLPFAVVTLAVLPAKAVEPTTVITIPTQETTSIVATTTATYPALQRTIDPWLTTWLVGMGVLSFVALTGAFRVRRLIHKAEPVPPGIQAFAEEFLGPRNRIPILQSGDIATPLLVGLRCPTVILPTSLLESEGLADVRLMLAHEFAHLGRRDAVWFVYFWLVQTLLFFNPVVWLAARCARLDHESATDEYAAKLAAVPVPTYAEMLLRATVVTRGPLAPGALTMSESYRSIHRRLEAMKHFKSQSTPLRTTATVALALAVVGLLPLYQLAQATPQSKNKSKSTPKVVTGKASGNLKPVVVQGKPSGKSSTKPVLAKGKRLKPVVVKGKAIPPAPAVVPAKGVPAPVQAPNAPALALAHGVPAAAAPKGVPGMPGEPATQPAPAAPKSVPGFIVPGGATPAPPQAKPGVTAPAMAPTPKPAGDPIRGKAAPATKPGDSDPFHQPGAPVSTPTPKGSDPFIPGKTAPTPTAKPGSEPPKPVGGKGWAHATPGSDAPTLPGFAAPAGSNNGVRTLVYFDKVGSLASNSKAPINSVVVSDALVSIDLHDVDVREALRVIFRDTKHQLKLEDKVNGHVTAKLDRVPFDECLTNLLKAVGASFVVENGVYKITPSKE